MSLRKYDWKCFDVSSILPLCDPRTTHSTKTNTRNTFFRSFDSLKPLNSLSRLGERNHYNQSVRTIDELSLPAANKQNGYTEWIVLVSCWVDKKLHSGSTRVHTNKLQLSDVEKTFGNVFPVFVLVRWVLRGSRNVHMELTSKHFQS